LYCLGGTTTTCTLADANIALQEAIATCDISYEKYEKQVNKEKFWKSAIGIAGTFAGSVGVPISSGDVALGLGGFAGATNATNGCAKYGFNHNEYSSIVKCLFCYRKWNG
jgi:hypothetical protein